MKKLLLKDKKIINQFRDSFPEEIRVKASRTEQGGFSVEILTFPGCVTEADTFSELVEMINDAVYTYFEIPEQFLSFMPSYIPSVEMARDLTGFPIRHTKGESLKLKLPRREKALC